MAHFAQIDDDNTVINVIVISNEYETRGQEYINQELNVPGTWIQTSYNANFRGKFAGIGDKYDAENDVFFTPKVIELESEVTES